MDETIVNNAERILRQICPEDRAWMNAFVAMHKRRAATLRTTLSWLMLGVGVALTVWVIWLGGGWLEADVQQHRVEAENQRLRDICIERLLLPDGEVNDG